MSRKLEQYELNLFQSAEATKNQAQGEYDKVLQELDDLKAKFTKDQEQLFQRLEETKTNLLRSQGAAGMATKMIIDRYEIDPNTEQVDLTTGQIVPRGTQPGESPEPPKVVQSPTKVVKPEVNSAVMPPPLKSPSYAEVE